VLSPTGRTRPSLRAYLRVLRHGPFVVFGIATIVRTLAAARSDAETHDVLAGVAIGLLLLIAYYPVWRWLATRWPDAATNWEPELLDGPMGKTELHPTEPTSNVRRVDG
jgi:hypothetical protein